MERFICVAKTTNKPVASITNSELPIAILREKGAFGRIEKCRLRLIRGCYGIGCKREWWDINILEIIIGWGL